MDQSLPPRLPANLECAVQRVRMAARSAAEHTVESLGLAALASSSIVQRDALLGAQYELNRKLAIFALTFNEALDTDVARQAGTLTATPGPALSPDTLVANWESLTLVDDHEVEIHISADRFALEISHACEWEIRELDAYMGTLLHLGAVDHDRNPLRAEVVGQAMIRAIEAVTDRPEVRKVLGTEIGRSLAHAMRQTYADIVADLRHAGVRPVGMAVRASAPRNTTSHGTLAGDSRHADMADSRDGRLSQHGSSGAGRLSVRGAPSGHRSGFGPSGRSVSGPSLGQIDAAMTELLQRLVHGHGRGDGDGYDDGDGRDESHWDGGHAAGRGGATDFGPQALDGYGHGHRGHGGHGGLQGDAAWDDGGHDGTWHHAGGPIAPNLIHAHRDALHEAATGALDRMVIDVVAGLFDQILSDNKVPPQVARQIARLQLPVLRAALGDSSFFSSRRHPVRRFVNRIASLGSAVEDFDSAEGRALVAQVARLVQEVVDGEFDQAATYEQKLQALDAFIAAQAQAEVRALGAADTVLARKEADLRVRQRYAQDLDDALQGLPVPDYLRAFLAETWSQAIASMAAEHGDDGEPTQRLRAAARALVMSVQPKGTPTERHQFLRQLPQLMKDLNTGLDRIRCPDDVRQAFFAQLLPAHAESLRGQSLSTLEHNLLVRKVDTALATPVPQAAEVAHLPLPTGQAAAALQAAAVAADFSPAEARAVGLVDESAVDWDGSVDIDLGAEPVLTPADLAIEGLPAPEAPEPTQGKSLADHVQIGFAYLMQLQGQWQQVRLAHVSAGRSFFVFTHGAKQRETVSMTYRMLSRLCTAGRLRALESAYLLERATARARRQLSALMPGLGGSAPPAPVSEMALPDPATAAPVPPPSRPAASVAAAPRSASATGATQPPARLSPAGLPRPAAPVPAPTAAASAPAPLPAARPVPAAGPVPATAPAPAAEPSGARRLLHTLFGRRG